jgi:hypothetical protein
VAPGVLPLLFVVLRLSCCAPHKEYQAFTGRAACGAEFDCLASSYHHAGFSLSVPSVCDGLNHPSVVVRSSATDTNTVWIMEILILGGHPKPAIKGHFKTGQR